MNESLLQSDELANGFNKLVVECLEKDPNTRPSMVDVYRSLFDLGEGSNMKAEAENAILNLSEELQSARGELSYVRSRRVGLEAQTSELQKMLGPMQSVEEEVQALQREKSELEDMERAASVQKQGSNMKAEAENAILNLSETPCKLLLDQRKNCTKQLPVAIAAPMLRLLAQASELQKMLGPMQSVEEEVQALRREKSELEDMERAASVQKQGLGGAWKWMSG